MREKVTQQIIWNEAGKAGLVLGLVCCAYSLITNGMTYAIAGNGILTTTLSFVLWIVKFLLCLGLMRHCITRFHGAYEGTNSRECVRFGRRVGLLSALVFAAYILAEYKYIFPAAYSEQWDTIMAAYSSMLDSNTASAMDSVKEAMPMIAAGTKFIYCYLWGSILALIFGMGIGNTLPKDNDIQQHD